MGVAEFTAAANSLTPILHLVRFMASFFSKPTLLLSSSTCVFHVFYGHSGFLLPLTFNIWIGVSSLSTALSTTGYYIQWWHDKLIGNFYKTLTALISCLTCSKVLHSSIVRVLVMAAGGAKSLLPSAHEELENLDVLKPEADFLIKPVWWGKINNILLDLFCNGVCVNLVWLFLLYNCFPFLQ